MDFEKVKEILAEEQKLLEIETAKKIIFIGDTHGDIEASQKIIKDYLKPENIIVFLGDYIDRGAYSKENLDFLIGAKIKNPRQIYLLQGNHEGHRILKFSPAEFWESLNKNEYQKHCWVLESLPLVIVAQDIIALHGVLPDIKNLDEINKIEIGDENWFRICWGDFSDESGEYLGINPFTGRPRFGKDYFLTLMKKFNKKVLIRSHQPDCPQFMFDNRCLTIFTSAEYVRQRTIAIFDFVKGIKDAKDLEIRVI